MIKVGVLAIQGAVAEHLELLNQIPDVCAQEVKYLDELNEIDGLIIPGGESTAIGRLLRDFNLLQPLKERILNGMPVWGTCAGMILLAKSLENDPTVHLGVMDITVERNAYGRQLGSFTTEVEIEKISSNKIPLVFIRAPYVTQVKSDVDILLEVNDHIVACQQKQMLATSFHPELTKDTSFHRYFINMIKQKA
ncbi:MAG: pyridoxal 5'-phosphate synthase glutaminase subunit PdxT [Turicibacter sp.]|uniref:Pyridoxal 5'-phosphate synthase subunit PdxT n=1 Tax=Turicibacter bilis TaxID=2735723 RepID=A0ABY5JFT9_9FIRM|nr:MULTISPECIES: pyridoxal 5'-phosphate synthase glutaminase subunit PdxT [Turicibacter]MEE0426288.1 pyridoxal 5'-phosphate synthase glutaminase subunit PdxT [Turicibacter sp.]CUN53171.1 Glutamine amidotransferase subunit pdxT [Turicibacter sanguinis]MBS3200808.1 pyridoxal 5'-phosphate synthase glutaminase subunit PdxT [Turicibacter bilis]MCU7192904.1 pyridoxal 5'-phosphate synthase glutaminase subunit PdxT [Turicibacter sp. T129]MCU7206684.1 pyridoxal 5'-phosphate synthase glutaminase subunit